MGHMFLGADRIRGTESETGRVESETRTGES